ncbi:nuclear factor 7, ovary [Trematomus bernacchii]|uniref:nuclear factor 7, ovary n=1 Tax=Trematomus bernacchii TaxID=40690 RepID=UPI00146DB6F9|nr:nuclear factor 7, ovary [Trematomus bernacchii]
MNQNHYKGTNNNNCSKSLLSDQKEKLIQAIKRIKHEVDECREAETKTFIESLGVENSFDALKREVRSEFENLHRFLDEEECKDLERLQRERQKQVKQLKEREKKIAAQATDLETAIYVLNKKLTEEDHPKLLREIQDLIKRQVFSTKLFSLSLSNLLCEHAGHFLSFLHIKSISITLKLWCVYPIDVPPFIIQSSPFLLCPNRSQVSFKPPAEVDTEVRSGQFVGPIQYRIWKHMKSWLYPSITSMTFDPETAHPNLSLSKSCTSVWFEEDKDTKGCQPNPQRFHYYYSVFGHQSFTTGRHYWEVEVGRKTAWRLGVARADVPRGEMDATGTSSGVWTMAMKGGSVVACTDPEPTKVNVSTRLVRIGLFLDCEKEELSFYNAVTMSPIYTFSMEYVGVALFPFFNPCDADEGRNVAALKMFNPSI